MKLALLTGGFLGFLLAQATAVGAELPAARVKVAPVAEQQLAPTSQLVGIVDFDRVAKLSTEVSGLIVSQFLDEGRLVQAGEVLVELNTDFLEQDIVIKRREGAQFAAEQRKIKASLKRLEALVKRNSASRQAYEDSLYDNQALSSRIAALDEQIARLDLQRQKSKIRAPFSGIILEKLSEQGEWIGQGDAAGTLAATDQLIVRVAVPEALIRFQHAGAAVSINIDALNTTLEGRVKAVVPVAERRSKTLVVKLEIPYQAGLARNLSANV